MNYRAFAGALLLAALLPFQASAQDVSATANSVFRDFNTLGNAATGAYNPPKSDVRALWAMQHGLNYNIDANSRVAAGSIFDAQIANAANIKASKLLFTNTGTGAASTLLSVRLQSGAVNAFTDCGADPTGAVEMSAALNSGACAASNKPIYLPTGNYTLAHDANLNGAQFMFGDGPKSKITVSSNAGFASGVIKLAAVEPGATLQDIAITFSQPATGISPTQYVPAIYAQNAPRFRVNRVRISQAWTCLDMRGNSGGALITDLQCSSYNLGAWIDGSFDKVGFDQFHFWPFDMNGGTIGGTLTTGSATIASPSCAPNCNNAGLYPDLVAGRLITGYGIPVSPVTTIASVGASSITLSAPATANNANLGAVVYYGQQAAMYRDAIGIQTFRMDDLKIANSIFFGAFGIWADRGALGDTFATLSNVAFDTFHGIFQRSGTITASSAYFTLAYPGAYGLLQAGGTFNLSSGFASNSNGTTAPIFNSQGLSVSCTLNGTIVATCPTANMGIWGGANALASTTVAGNGIPQGTMITGTSISGSNTQLVLSQAATLSGTSSLNIGVSHMGLQNIWMEEAGWDQTFVSASAGADVSLVGNYFSRGVGSNYTNASVVSTGAGTRLMMTGNRSTPKGGGTGNVVSIDTDNYHVMQGNSFPGWSMSLPSVQALGQYEGAWPSNASTITHVSGVAATAESATVNYTKLKDRTWTFTITYTVTTLGSGTGGFVSFSVPFGTFSGSQACTGNDVSAGLTFPAATNGAGSNLVTMSLGGGALAAHNYVATCTAQTQN